MFKSFQGETLFTVIGWSDQQQKGLTEMFVRAAPIHTSTAGDTRPNVCNCPPGEPQWSADSKWCQILDLQQHGVLLRPQLVSDLEATHQLWAQVWRGQMENRF